MKIKVIKDYQAVPQGTVGKVIKENKKTYQILWSSMFGTYNYTIPKDRCKIL